MAPVDTGRASSAARSSTAASRGAPSQQTPASVTQTTIARTREVGADGLNGIEGQPSKTQQPVNPQQRGCVIASRAARDATSTAKSAIVARQRDTDDSPLPQRAHVRGGIDRHP